MEQFSPAELIVAAGEGRSVVVVRGTARDATFAFSAFADIVGGIDSRASVHTTDLMLTFLGSGTVRFLPLSAVRDGALDGLTNPLVAATRFYHPHELDEHLPDVHERVEG